jgi:hopene-associated glycosyltransferase HpnB
VHWLPIANLAGVTAVIIWGYLLTARGGFWRAKQQIVQTAPEGSDGDRVSVVVPARNEADVIGPCVSSLLEQRWKGAIQIILVDDGSTDGTAAVALQAARRAGAEARLTTIPGSPLPPGWSGKLWAVEQGVRQALRFEPDFLLLTDADIVHDCDSLATLIATAQRGGFDLTSLMVRLHCRSVAEKLLIPAFVFFFFKLYPPRWIANERHKIAGAAGGCMLVRPYALAAAGGLTAIRSEIIDDCALAALIKRSGRRIYLGLAPVTTSIRPYRSFAEIGNMIARTAFNQLKHSAWLLVGSLVGLALTYLIPVAGLLGGLATHRAVPAVLGALAWAMMTVAYAPMVRYYGLSPAWALTLPATAAFYMGATIISALRYWSGRGGQWKGRTQDVTESQSSASSGS